MIFLPGEVPSSKNSKRILYKFNNVTSGNTYVKQGGSFRRALPFISNSEFSNAYIRDVLPSVIANRRKFLDLIEEKEKPLKIQMRFIRKTKSRWDFHNLCQIVLDCISGHHYEKRKDIPVNAVRWFEDDDTKNMLVYPPLEAPYYEIDKENPGVWIIPF